MAGEIGYINLADADTYFETRLAADAWNDIVDDSSCTTKTAALTTAYSRIYYSGLWDLPLAPTAAQLVILSRAQCELALYMLIHLEDEDRRKGIQAQGVTRSDIVKEMYRESDMATIPIPPFVAAMLQDFSTGGKEFYVTEINRDEDDDIEF